MAAYSAVASFGELLNNLLVSKQFPPDCTEENLQFLHENVSTLQSSVETIFPAPKDKREGASVLENKIREAIYEAQDTFESSVIESLSSESYEIGGAQSSTSMEKIKTSIDTVAKEAKTLADLIAKGRKTRTENVQSSESIFVSRSTKIVGQDEDRRVLKAELMNASDDKLQVVPISGMAGIGKTTLAKSIYEDEEIEKHFAIRAWVTVSQDYNVGEILGKLLSSMKENNRPMDNRSHGGDDRNLSAQLRQNLYDKRYLVVIDDMWDEKVWDKVKNSLPDDRKGSRIVLTTRLAEVAEYAKPGVPHHKMRTLDENESWELLSHVAFAGNPDDAFKDIGTKIGKSCGGLPLSLTVVGGLLSQGEKTKEYWGSIAEDVNAAVKNNNGAESYKEILALSYIHLPSKLKGCFLYMGLFPEDSEIFVSKLIMLWVSEGFLDPSSPPQMLEKIAKGFLKNLIDRNLVYVRNFGAGSQIKACGMHDTLRDLAMQESGNEKFFHSIRKYVEELEEGAESQRRVSVHKNILMCLEKVYQSTTSIKGARSLLYVGPHHHHPLPSNLTFKLLRVFDAFTVYFIEFPYDVFKLIHLRYLSLTYNGKFPKELSKLRKLQVLVVRRQPKIIFVGSSFLPEEIWDMSELRHLILTESDLPLLSSAKILDPNSALLKNLQTLSNVNATSCTKEVLQNMPNLKKLGMWFESPGDLDFYVNDLVQLEAFKFIVLNPIPGKKVNFKPPLIFPKTLRKLTLSGCGLPWEDIEVVMQLPHLEVLKLRELAFHGEVWDFEKRDRFPVLRFLLLEYVNLKYWGAMHYNFPSLERLIIKHCYELEEMNPEIGDIGGLQLIEMVDCSPEAVKWAEEIKKEQKDNKDLQVRIYSSWA